MWIEAERAGVDQQGGPDQIQAGRASRCLTNRIELGRRAREIGGGAAQAIGGHRRSGQCELSALEFDDPYAAAGMLGGMMTMEPRRAVMFGRGVPLTPAQIAERARTCVRLFLGGCLKDHVRTVPGAAAPAPGLEAEPNLRSGV